MEGEKLKELQKIYYSLRALEELYDKPDAQYVRRSNTLVLNDLLQKLNKEFPNIIHPFNIADFYAHRTSAGLHIYNLPGIRTYIAAAIGHIQVELEQTSDTTVPVTEKRQFRFIIESDLRTIIERDYIEIQSAFIAKCWKSVIILCGGTIEAILTDLLLTDSHSAKSAKSAPKKDDIKEWGLADIIKVAVELKLVPIGVDKLSHSVREYRNLIHPGYELIHKLRFGQEEARIALEVLNILQRDLSGK